MVMYPTFKYFFTIHIHCHPCQHPIQLHSPQVFFLEKSGLAHGYGCIDRNPRQTRTNRATCNKGATVAGEVAAVATAYVGAAVVAMETAMLRQRLQRGQCATSAVNGYERLKMCQLKEI